MGSWALRRPTTASLPVYHRRCPLVALLTACHFGMMLLYHVLLALGRHLFFEIQIFGDQIRKLLADSL